MFAGGRLQVHAPIPVGALLSSRSEVANIAIKSGRSGEMAFVTVRTELTADGVPAGVEEQDIVYRSEARERGRAAGGRPRPGTGVLPSGESGRAASWRPTLCCSSDSAR